MSEWPLTNKDGNGIISGRLKLESTLNKYEIKTRLPQVLKKSESFLCKLEAENAFCLLS